jgi:N-acetylglucosamine kinase-like BadF-type ATPase
MAPITDATESELTSATADLLLAIDSGGTKTTAYLVQFDKDGTAHVIGRGRSTGGNPLSVGFAEAKRVFADVAAQVLRDARLPNVAVPRAIMSIAGAADPDVRVKLLEWGHATKFASRIAIVSDFLPVLAAGTDNCVGVALVSGTGSSAFARNADGRTARCGGWGYLLGDEGSGYAIGRAALQLALRALEFGRKGGSLERSVLAELRADSVADVTHAVYSSSDVRARVAAMAPIVIAAADIGESTALSILDSAARELAELVARAARSVNLAPASLQLAVSGGMLLNAQPLRDRLQTELRELGLACSICVVDDPLEGCVRLAGAELAGTLVTWH